MTSPSDQAAPAGYLGDQYAAKDESYYTGARSDYIAALATGPNAAILEIGCGDGATGALALREGKCGSYVGIEMFEPMARRAREALTQVHIGNVETMELPYPPGHFDALIMSEVLEHLVDPEAVVKRLVALLKPGAAVFASSPNIANWRIVRNLLLGRFDPTESGIMDRTHLRWFTPRSFRRMFEKAGIEVIHLEALGAPRSPGLLRRLLGRRFGHLLWGQINLHGRKRSA
jgi:2-polyprenyl-3-methyl-5-hydroxy-6-metoxy-1,4-benzoquinol methylase